MTDRINVTMTLELFVEDASALRGAAFERLQNAWTSDDKFPYESAADVPIDQAVHSVLADALPAELPGCRRSQLEVETETREGDDDSDSDSDDNTDDADDTSDSDDDQDGEAEDDAADSDAKTDSDDEGDKEDAKDDDKDRDS